MPADVAAALREEARRANERRLLVLAGDHEATLAAANQALNGARIDRERAVYVGPTDAVDCQRFPMERAGELLGTTNDAVVFDAHAGLRPTALGRVVGAVDGGGLLVLCCPTLDGWADRRDPADERFAVPPFDAADVSGRFRRRFVDVLRGHRGVAIIDVDADRVLNDGLTDPPAAPERPKPRVPADATFPTEAYEACLTRDQANVLRSLEGLLDPGQAMVLESDRGRGKSSVAGIAAACLAVAGYDVAVSAPAYRNAREIFTRATELVPALDPRATREDAVAPYRIETASGGSVRFVEAGEIEEATPDVLVVDEAAGLGVPRLVSCLRVDRIVFATTVHGYEGAGRGFSVRFRDHLDDANHTVTDLVLEEPIRYGAGDPVEVWAFRALLLDARPPVTAAVEDAEPVSAEYRSLTPEVLLEDESLLREAFGLLVLAHYRTEPDDLARLLDAPNIRVRGLLYKGRVVSIALLAREGGLPRGLRQQMYEGGRVRGNMLPDVLTSQLRDESAGRFDGWRILRIATHHAVRSRGLGSALLEAVETELGDGVDWLGTGFGATPALISFWADAGYRTIHLSTTRNDESGEHSVIMIRPMTAEGGLLADRHANWFVKRVREQLPDAIDSLDPDMVRTALRATAIEVEPELSEEEWRLVAGMAYGPGLLDVDPGPFKTVVAAHLIDPAEPELLTDEAERLLVRRVLQAHSWGTVAAELGYHSRSECMRAVGNAFQSLVDCYGTKVAIEERDRYR